MAGKKDPSIYDDRSSLGSSDELDEYGVWVKSESQDLSSALPDLEELPEITDAGDSDLPDFSDFSAAAAGIIDAPGDDFDMPELDASDLPGGDFDMPEPEMSALPDDDLDIPDLDTSDLPGGDFDMPEPDMSALPDDNLGIPEPAAPGFPESSPQESASYGDDDDIIGQTGPLVGPDLEFVELVDESQLPSGSASELLETSAVSAAPKSDSFAEVSMDDFMDTPSSSAPKSIDFGNLDARLPDDEPPSSGKGIDLSNQLLMKIADELSSIKKELSSLKQEFSVVRGEVKEAKAEPAESKGGGFFEEDEDEKIALTGDELDNILHTANFTEESGSDEGLNNDLSLDDLGVPAAPAAVSEAPAAVSEAPAALSDQEDIISESGEELLVEDQSAEETVDISFDDTDLTELDGALKVEDEIKDAVDSFDSSLDIESDLPDFDDMGPDLNNLREMGVRPVTPPPEDTSYLEADPLASAPIEEESIDLSSAIIEEPDLSSQIVENPVFEPALDDISIDIDMEQPEISEGPGPEDFVFETEETMEIPADSGIEEFIEEPVDFEPAISEPAAPEPAVSVPVSKPEAKKPSAYTEANGFSSSLKEELKIVLSYMDQLLESLPEEKIEEFAKSEYFETYKKLFEELGLA